MVGEEAPRVIVVLVWPENTDASSFWTVSDVEALCSPVSPDDAQEQRSGGRHYTDVGQYPVAVVLLQVVNNTEEERVAGDCAHHVVGDSSRHGAAHPCRVGEQRVEASVTTIVQIDVDSTIVRQHKIPNRVRALDGVLVVLESFEEPRVFSRNEVPTLRICPKLVFPVILVQLQTRCLRLLPHRRYALVDVCLVDDLRDHLWSSIDQARARCWQFGA